MSPGERRFAIYGFASLLAAPLILLTLYVLGFCELSECFPNNTSLSTVEQLVTATLLLGFFALVYVVMRFVDRE